MPEELPREVEDLRAALREARETLDAIRGGHVDAIVVSGPGGDHVLTLQSADYTYRHLVERMDEGAGTLSDDGTILYANHCLADMLQAPLQEVIGGSTRRYVAAAELRQFDAMLRKALQGTGEGETTLQRSDGSGLPVHLALSRAGFDSTQAVCMVVTDLSLQKRSEQIVADEQLARSILEQAAEPIVVCDLQGMIIRANGSAAALCNCNPMLQPFDEVWGLQDAQGRPLQLFRQPGQPPVPCRSLEAIFPRRDGQAFSLIVSIGSLNGPAGKVIGCVITLTDITQRKRMEQQLKVINQTLEQRVRERTAVAEQRAAQLRALAGQLTQAEQRERHRLAMVLHDHLQQLLVGAKFNARILYEHLPAGELRQQLQAVDELLDQPLEASRSLTAELSADRRLAASSVASSGFGLFSIRERLELMGGRMEVDSAPGRGTRIRLTAPLRLVRPGAAVELAGPAAASALVPPG